MTTLGFIGLGNMGAAILQRYAKSDAAKEVSIYGYDTFGEKQTWLEQIGGIWCNSEVEVAQSCKYVVLAVKPQGLDKVLAKIAPMLTEESVLISICAGITVDYIRNRTNPAQKVFCVMPNTPALIGEGASTVAYNCDNFHKDDYWVVSGIFNSCGVVQIISHEQANAAICLNGSSPAFVYLFAKCFMDYAKGQGINTDVAKSLIAQSLIGAGKMLLETRNTPSELIAQVASKGGTTEAGLAALHEQGFCEAVKAACEACTKRAYELGKE